MTRPDYIKPGSAAHAGLLGLRKAKEKDTYVLNGWTLLDPTAFGPQATEAYIEEVLRQKVSELEAGAPPAVQSEDRTKPGYAPPMWQPAE